MTSKKNDLILIGAVLSAKGLKGEILVKYFSENFSALKNYSYLFIGNQNDKYQIKNVSARKENFIMNLKEITNRAGAEGLKGQEIYIEKAQLKNLENEEWYHEDLIGLNVQTSSGNEFGKIQAIFNFGAGDILEIKLVNNKLEMIPFNKDFVLEIILNDKIIISDMETK